MACAGERSEQPAMNADSAGTDFTAESLPAMPRYPAAATGRINVASEGGMDLSNVAATRAGVCEEPAMLQVLAEAPGRHAGESWAILVLLALPGEDERETRYDIVTVASGLPTPPAAQVAVQVLSREGGFAFQAVQGHVQVYAYGAVVSGRFQITVREINADDIVQLAGVFEQAPIEQLSSDQCRVSGAA